MRAREQAIEQLRACRNLHANACNAKSADYWLARWVKSTTIYIERYKNETRRNRWLELFAQDPDANRLDMFLCFAEREIEEIQLDQMVDRPSESCSEMAEPPDSGGIGHCRVIQFPSQAAGDQSHQ